MRALAALLVTAAVAFVIYHFAFSRMPVTDSGTAPTQAINLTGVRADLLQIAQAERGNIALNSKCASVDELISSGSLSMTGNSREGYTYEVECSSGADFRVVASHPPAPEGSPIRYPTLTIDSNLAVTSR